MSYFSTLLRNPFTILGSMGIGILLGIFQKDLSLQFSFLGTLYLTVLQMSVIPLVFVLVTVGVSNLASLRKEGHSLSQFIYFSFIGLLFISSVGIITSRLFRPGEFSSPEVYEKIMRMQGVDLSRVISVTEPIEPGLTSNIKNFILQLFPENVFHAFAEGKTLQLVVFAVIFGAALGLLPKTNYQRFKEILEAAQQSLQKIITMVIFLFPIGIIFIMSAQIAQLSFEIISVLMQLIFFSLIGFAFLYLLAAFVIWKSSGLGFWHSQYATSNPVILALTTRNTLVSLPSTIESLVQNFKYSRENVEFSLPLGISLLRFGNILYFSFLAVLIAQLYNVPLGPFQYFFILLGSIVAGIATAGTSGVASLGLLAIVAEPLGLPISAALVFLILIDPIIDPFRTLTTLYCNAALVSYLNRKK